MQSVHYRILRSHKDTLHGRSGEIRTRGLLNPIGREYLPARASTLQTVKKAGISPELQILIVGISKKCTPNSEKVYPDALYVL